MTLLELSAEYRESAELLRSRLRTLRCQLRRAEEPAVCFSLQRRIAMLTELLRQTKELAELTERYYERGYWRNEKYTVGRVCRPLYEPAGPAPARCECHCQ